MMPHSGTGSRPPRELPERVDAETCLRPTGFTGTSGDAVDLVDLRRASALLRYRVARDGVVLVERCDGAFRAFQPEAVHFWCDAGPVIRAAQDDVLAALGDRAG